MRVTHIVLDCHFHHEQQWRAAMTTTHSLHQLKYIIIHPKFWANHYIESESSVSVTFLGKWDDAVIMSVTNQGTVLMKRSTEQRNVLHLCCSALQHTNLNFSLTTNRRLHLYEVDQKVGNLAVINIPLKLMSLTTCRSRPNCFLCSSSEWDVAKFSTSISTSSSSRLFRCCWVSTRGGWAAINLLMASHSPLCYLSIFASSSWIFNSST